MQNNPLPRAGRGLYLAAALTLLAPVAALAQPEVKVLGEIPFGQEAKVEVRRNGQPAHLPGTRFARRGPSAFDIDVEFIGDAFGPFPPGSGLAVVSLGELVPGHYQLRTRTHDISGSDPADEVISSLRVGLPTQPGIYTVPQKPRALSPVQVLLSSAIHIETSSVRVSMAPSLVRVDFQFHPSAATHAAPPDGYAPVAAVALPPLNPGIYRMEAWGAPYAGATPQLYFTNEIRVERTTGVVEFYHEGLDHYFITARAEDIDALDSGAYGDWKRTGQGFHAWARAADAPGSLPVCRFYAPQHNSHFFTADANECEGLKREEQRARAQAQAAKQSFGGWQFEGVAFHSLLPADGACPAGTLPVQRFFNGRAAQNDANHRFTPAGAQPQAMPGWIDEGIAFCAPL